MLEMKYQIHFVIAIFFLISYGYSTKLSCSIVNDLVVETKTGKLNGSCYTNLINDVDSTISKDIYNWLSIPYAKPPIGEKRFGLSEAIEPWSDVRDATNLPKMCMQPILNKNFDSNLTSEDCLYLNIWVPSQVYLNRNNQSVKKAPIMIYFHSGGGIYSSGSAEEINPSVFVATNDVIVVTFNFRLGPFGFLYLDLENEKLPGNQGILDQHLVLKWVFENAEVFGGDSSKISLVGQSYGATAISYHLLYEPSWKYFRNVILLSGFILNTIRTAEPAHVASNKTKEFLESLGCKQGEFMECVKKFDSSSLLAKTQSFVRYNINNNRTLAERTMMTPFFPVVDGKIVTDSPRTLFENQKFKDCKIIMGFTSSESAKYLPNIFGKSSNDSDPIVDFELLVNFLKEMYVVYPSWPSYSNDIFFNIVLNEYTHLNLKSYNNSNLLKKSYLKTLIKIMSHERFICPTMKLAELISKKNNNLYLYLYDYRLTYDPLPEWKGVVHTDDLYMLFGHPLRDNVNIDYGFNLVNWPNISYSIRDKIYAREYMSIMANFIKNNEALIPTSKIPKKWRNYALRTSSVKKSSMDNLYLHFDEDSIKMTDSDHIDTEKCDLWTSLLPATFEVLNNLKKVWQSEAQISKNV